MSRSITALFTLTFCATLSAQSVCSTRSLVGAWAASSEGNVLPNQSPPPIAGPGAAVGLVSIDYNGQISINLTGNVGGGIGPLVATGTITVDPDCTGTLHADTQAGWTLSEKIVVLDHGNEVRTIAIGPYYNAKKPVVWQCRWKRLSRVPLPMPDGMASCSAQTIRGTWVGSFDGVVLSAPPPAPPVPTGILTRGVVDHRQELSGEYTASVGGQVSSGEYAGSVIEVNPDCTGKWSYQWKGVAGTHVEHFVIVDHGREIWSLPAQGILGMPVGLVRYTRMSPVPFQ